MHEQSKIFHFFKDREMNELYVSAALRAFAISMTGIFIPIYLYQIGYSFSNIFLFYGFSGLIHALFVFPSARISSRFGMKHAMFASIPFLILFFLLLYSLESYTIPVFLLALPVGISTSLFWFSYHADFSKFSSEDHRGSQVGFSRITSALASVLGPIIGGIILIYLGFHILFIIVSVVLLSSVFPLFMSSEIHEPLRFSLKGFFKGGKIREILAYVGYGAEMRLGTVVWPLFIFIFILGEKYLSLGLVSSLALFFAMIFTFFIGKLSNTNKKKIIFKIGIIFNSLIWVAKSFIVTPLQVFVADSFYGASQATIHVSFDTLVYERAKRQSIMRTIARREFFVHLGAFLFFMLLILFSDSLVEVFRYGGPLSGLIRFFF